MSKTVTLESPVEEKRFIQVCETTMPSWLRNAIDGSDNQEMVARMNELNARKEACLKRLEQSESSSLTKIVERKVVAANDCARTQRKSLKSMML